MIGTVLIAGAGPVGLTLAGELRLSGVDVVVLERLAEPVRWARSLFLQNRSVEVLRQRGLPWFADAPRWVNYNFGFLKMKRLKDDAEFVPFYAPQHEFEALLEEWVRQLGADVRRGHELVALDQDGSGVRVTVSGPDGEYGLEGPFLVGCDGGRSTVRKLAGIDFPGTASTLSGITGWVTLAEDQFPGGIHADIHPTGIFAMARMESDLYRATSIEFETPLPDRDVPPTVDELRDAVRRIAGVDLKVAEAPWLSRFGNATRIAAQYRRGRVLLAGDAAHIHFASAAQGLNTGIQDAVNLGWKLAAELAGWAPPRLLDTYHDERRPVAERVCMFSQAQVALYHPIEHVAPLRDLVGQLLQFDDVSRHMLELATGTGIRYPMAAGPDRHPMVGLRLPDAQLVTATRPTTVFECLHRVRPVVLDASGGTPPDSLSGWKDRVDVVRAEPTDALGAARVLVRPDGYVAWADDGGVDDGRADDDGLRAALTAWFGEPSGAQHRQDHLVHDRHHEAVG